jgi:hypothetical protein
MNEWRLIWLPDLLAFGVWLVVAGIGLAWLIEAIRGNRSKSK